MSRKAHEMKYLHIQPPYSFYFFFHKRKQEFGAKCVSDNKRTTALHTAARAMFFDLLKVVLLMALYDEQKRVVDRLVTSKPPPAGFAL